MAIALVGGSGFIGSRIAEILLESSLDFFIVDKETSTKYPERTRICDIRDYEVLKDRLSDADIVVNLAAEHRDDVSPLSLYEEVNVGGTRNICRAASELGIHRIIFTSSVAVYGETAPESDEQAACRPFNEYGKTKLAAEEVLHDWESQDERNSLAIIRPTVVFGESNRGNVYNLFYMIASKRFLIVGNGENRKAMAYVGNVAAFIVFIITHENLAETWNYVDTPVLDMNRLVSLIRETLHIGRGTGFRLPRPLGYLGGLFFDILAGLSGRKFSISRIRIRKFTTDSSFSAAKAAGTGFKPPYQLDDSLNRVLSFEFPEQYHGHSKEA